MTSPEKPLVYLILGAAGSGRRAVVADLIEGGVPEGEKAYVLLSSLEQATESDARLGSVGRWNRLEDGSISTEEGDPFGGAQTVFFVTDGRLNPVDQIEAFKAWIEQSGGELARVLCVVNCRLAANHREVVAWYEACIHFSDIVLLAERDGVANKWLSDFQNRFKDQFFPCLFEMVKAGHVKNPALVLAPQPRRMSHFFDPPEWMVVDDEEGSDAEDADEDADESEEEVELVEKVDPYIELRGGGRRVKEIPDIRKFLEREEKKD